METIDQTFATGDKYITISYKSNSKKVYIDDNTPDEDIKLFIDSIATTIKEYCPFDMDSVEWVYCLVGNIIEEHIYGENKEKRYGTKHFAPGTKVICYPASWGDGYEMIYVLGKPRKTFKLIKVIMRREYITNFRLKRIYDKRIINEMYHNGGWNNSIKSKEEIIEMANWLNADLSSKDEKENIE
jgi:hypothetical protein